MKIIELLENYDCKIIQESCTKDIKNIAYDSRKVEDGTLFVCLKGNNSDGHAFIEKAVSSGATAVIVEDVPDILPENVNVIKVKDSKNALAYVACRFYGEAFKDFKLIGITGTRGKTSVARFLKELLETAGCKTGIIGTLGSFAGNKQICVSKNTVTTPMSLELQKIFSEMKNEQMQYVIMEVTSHGLELNRVDYCTYDTGILTNIFNENEHLEFHKTFENYKNAKLKLFKNDNNIFCKKAVVNVDSQMAQDIMDILPCFVTYGIENAADVGAKNVVFKEDGAYFKLNILDNKVTVFMHDVIEYRDIYNFLTVIATGISLEIDIKDILRWCSSKVLLNNDMKCERC